MGGSDVNSFLSHRLLQLSEGLVQATNAAGVSITDRTCLIMDEVDGMSAGDRGGVGALNALIKKTRVRTLLNPYYLFVVTTTLTGSNNLHCKRPWGTETQASHSHYVQHAIQKVGPSCVGMN